ncbi:MAG: hypothetical protein A4E52_00916 [Pelotomaculum sp. PtaB.Bin013]|nr:MAG: hypothetical protein A4E52_00916 [Pelotomaculum sp. PtaB.Bin013]
MGNRKAFLDSKRGPNGLLSAKDVAAYEKMEAELEAARLKEQKTAFLNSLAGEQSAVTEAEELYKYLAKDGGIIEEFDNGLFERFVSGITVFSPVELGFKLKCGLVLRERIVR